MRWRAKWDPKAGETRALVKFAWKPVRTETGIVVWLERYVRREEFELPEAPP